MQLTRSNVYSSSKSKEKRKRIRHMNVTKSKKFAMTTVADREPSRVAMKTDGNGRKNPISTSVSIFFW
jgi:hypothetical protein